MALLSGLRLYSLMLIPALELQAGPARLVIDGFEGALTWEVTRNITGQGDCRLSLTDGAKAGHGALLVTDRCAERHAQWLLKRCPKGLWDLSRWQTLRLWVRGDASRRTLYFKAVDEAGKQMFWRVGRLYDRDWCLLTLDLTRDDSVFRHENPNLARVVAIGLRIAPHHGYEIAFDDLWLAEPVETPVNEWPRASVGEFIAYLKPKHVDDIENSIVGVNLHPRVGRLTEEDIDRLAGAGVKWAARLPLNLEAPYDARIRQALLKHRFKLHGLFGVSSLLEGQGLERRLAYVRRTVAGLKHIVRHWEIGNEPNIAKFWSGKPDATEFGLMVKAFAQTIRQAQPDATIISGGLVGYPLDFAKEMLDTGMADWVDYIGIHTPRSRPEDGGRGQSHADALAAFHPLIRTYKTSLEVWQSEVQATPNVTFAEVKGGISDYQQARHVARRFFVEQWLGYPASFWQLFKAGPALDHPGALLRVDGTPTMKFFAIQNVAAILDRTLRPTRASVSANAPTAPLLLWQGGAAPVQAPPAVNLDLLAHVTTESRTVDARLHWLNSKGEEIGSISSVLPVGGGPGTVSICRRYPHKFQPAGAAAARATIQDPAGRPLVVHEARVIAHSRAPKLRAHTFRRAADGALFVAYWLTPRPPPQTVSGVCTVTIDQDGENLRDPVIIDMISGEVHRVPQPIRGGGASIFRDLPVADYATVLTDLASIQTQPQSTLLSHFEDEQELVTQYIADRFGRGRSEFWRLVDEAASVPGRCRPKLSQAYRRVCEQFTGRLIPVEGKVEVRDVPTRCSRVESPAWRTSIVNPKSNHVDRYFTDIQAPGLDESGLRVVVATQAWPKKGWQDSEDRACSWFVTKTGQVWRLFLVVPNGQDAPLGVSVEYVHDACIVRAFCFQDRVTKKLALVYWAEPIEGVPIPSAMVTLVGPSGLVLSDAGQVNGRVHSRVPLQASPAMVGQLGEAVGLRQTY